METHSAAEHLQVIRTLMERSAVYRRALAPLMTFAGIVGVVAAALGCLLQIDSPGMFILYWFTAGLIAVAGSLLLVRRQALKDAEPFWSLPTRRVAHAMLPGLVAGFVVGVVILIRIASDETSIVEVVCMLWLPLGWIVLYGCALCAAGFFTLRGIKLFGWAFILAACGLFAIGIPDSVPRLYYAHGIMGFFFGVLHVAYGAYLYMTEKGKNVA